LQKAIECIILQDLIAKKCKLDNIEVLYNPDDETFSISLPYNMKMTIGDSFKKALEFVESDRIYYIDEKYLHPFTENNEYYEELIQNLEQKLKQIPKEILDSIELTDKNIPEIVEKLVKERVYVTKYGELRYLVSPPNTPGVLIKKLTSIFYYEKNGKLRLLDTSGFLINAIAVLYPEQCRELYQKYLNNDTLPKELTEYMKIYDYNIKKLDAIVQKVNNSQTTSDPKNNTPDNRIKPRIWLWKSSLSFFSSLVNDIKNYITESRKATKINLNVIVK
jgi:hypothetical protein